jgi:predicted deacylase
MHGDEPAGSYAAEQIRHWPIQAGRLVVVPRVNTLGLSAKTRWFPPLKEDTGQRDLNRNFPTADRNLPRSPVAEALWELVEQQKPDFVIDLHEGFDFHSSNPKSVGSSIIFSMTAR